MRSAFAANENGNSSFERRDSAASGSITVGGSPIAWKFGFVNEAERYLTAEPFGYKLNASATTLKKRQTWSVQAVGPSEPNVFLFVSHLNKFLSTDKDGRVTCDQDASAGPTTAGEEEKFLIEYCPKMSGRWAIKSQAYGYYFGGQADQMSCFHKTPVWWSARLVVHPQVHMKNLNRRRYVRLQGDELIGDQIIPWGCDSLITLEHSRSGKIAVCSRDRRYLDKDGVLTDKISEETLYNLELHSTAALSGISFCDRDGKYLTLVGSGGMKSKNRAPVGKDEIFLLEQSAPQFAISGHNAKFASIKQGIDVYTNQDEVDETEIFQFEFVETPDKWRIQSCQGKYWTVANVNSGIKASASADDPNTVFQLEQQFDESSRTMQATLRAENGQLVSCKKLGLMTAASGVSVAEASFQLLLWNRPLLVLRSDGGMVGCRNGRVETNMANYEAFQMELFDANRAIYTLKNSSGLFWQIDPDNQDLLVLGAECGDTSKFTIRFQSDSLCSIISCANGKMVHGDPNGTIRADSTEVGPTTLWQF